ncbi:DUF3987 domain-containing protein [Novosphingobium sp.]|uniref:DUF3987 domain-containing protein n=1 Tax=Novosphingobium sp. TaxID=1874826 RepID=UPI00286E7051|nr:DUF3987 domain-containing protein [Novosphingobium sp.]
MRAARFIHVDIDPPKSGGAFDKPAIAAAMLDIDAPPSFIIDSGGGLQAFWRLDGLAENLAAIEGINMQVRDYFEADACQNIDRLMRVPGSVNWPDKKKQMRGRVPRLATFISEDDGTVYAPEELAASFPPAKPSAANAPTLAAVNVPANITLITCDDLGLSALDPIRIAIEQPPGHDRSGDGLAAARIMANAGHADAQIIGALLNPANPVAAHFLAQRSPLRAASRAIQLVRADGPGEGETLHAPAMSQEDWDRFVANCKAKVNRAMVPAQLREPDPDEDIIATPRIGVPAWRRDLGDGAMAQFIDHVTSTAPSPQPWLTLGAALPMFGAAAGRRYAGPTNLRTNIYSIGIARSGGGKDRPLSASIDLMIAAGLANHVGSSKIASGSGLITAVTRNPSIYFPIDEIGFLIAAAANKNKAPKHIVEIMEILTEFYPRSNGRFLGTAYANDKERPREVIEQPNLCLFGVTTPRVFWGALSSANMEDGSLARMLIFETDNDYPDLQHNLIPKPIPDNLIEVVKAISDGADGHNPFPMGQGSAIVPKPYTVPYANAEAAALLIEMRNEQVDMNRRNENDIVSGVIARLAENTAKVALVKAITENPQSPTISVADLEWGMEIARKSVESLIKAARETVADSEHETMVKRVMKVIADAGSAGIDGTSLSRKTQFIDRRKRGDIIAGLIEAGMIRAMKMPKPTTGGPDKFVYFDIA